MRSGKLEITHEDAGPVAVLRVRGSVDLESSPELRIALQSLLKVKPPVLVVNLDEADYVDTSGLATFVDCAQEMRRYGGKLMVSGLEEKKTDTLSLAQVRGALSMFRSEAEALAQFKKQQ